MMRLLAAVVAIAVRLGAAEQDEVKRARLALASAEAASTEAGDACRAAEYEKCVERLSQVRESVEAAKDSLDATGIDPARHPRHFKDAEIRTRKILRLLEALRSYVHPDDGAEYEMTRSRVSEINDQLLAGIMSKRKKKKK